MINEAKTNYLKIIKPIECVICQGKKIAKTNNFSI